MAALPVMKIAKPLGKGNGFGAMALRVGARRLGKKTKLFPVGFAQFGKRRGSAFDVYFSEGVTNQEGDSVIFAQNAVYEESWATAVR